MIGFLVWSGSANAGCETASGVNLTDAGKPFASIYPRDQGRLGNCFSYAGCDLLRSKVKGPSPFNTFDAAINTEADVNGGDPSEVMNGLIKRGWACTDTYRFQNMFPSTDKNIIADFERLTRDMPVFYVNDPNGNQARQDRIAKKAAALASNPGSCYLLNDSERLGKEISTLYDQISKADAKVVKLEQEKNMLDWGWLNYMCGSRDNYQIQADINAQKKIADAAEAKVGELNKKKDNVETKLNQGKNRLDSYSEDEAAQIVYAWGKNTYDAMRKTFLAYGLDAKNIPSLQQYITERVQKDPKNGYMYAGRMYGYKLVKRAMANSCQPPNRQSIPSNLVAKRMANKDSNAIKQKITSQIQSSNGIEVSLHADFLQKGSWSSEGNDMHAVLVVGCKTVNGQLQYLIHNSWGAGCNGYAARFQCVGGRIWVPADQMVSASREVEWLQNK